MDEAEISRLFDVPLDMVLAEAQGIRERMGIAEDKMSEPEPEYMVERNMMAGHVDRIKYSIEVLGPVWRERLTVTFMDGKSVTVRGTDVVKSLGLRDFDQLRDMVRENRYTTFTMG